MAIAFDAITETNVSTSTTVTFAHTCSGSNRILWVGYASNETGATLASATYNGVTMTSITILNQTTYTPNSNYVGYAALIAPALGTHNVVMTFNATTDALVNATSYTGVLQTGLPDSGPTSGQGNDPTSTFSDNLTIVADGSWMVNSFREFNGRVTGISGTQRGAGIQIWNDFGPLSPGSNNFTYTISSPTRFGAHFVVAMAPAAVVASTSNLLLFT